MKTITKKDKRRLILLLCIFIPLLVVFMSNTISYVSIIYGNKRDKKMLEEKYKETLEREEMLKSEIMKLQDEEYVARYARERYLYSKDGEIIIRIDE